MTKPATIENIKTLVDEIVDQMVIKDSASEQITFICKDAEENFEDVKAADLRDLATKVFNKTYKTETYEKAREKVERNYQIIDSMDRTGA